MGFEGINTRESVDLILVRERLLDAAGDAVTTGDTYLYLYELQSDGTLLSYDWDDDTFKAGALTTETVAMVHQQGNNSTTDTGVWTYPVAVVTGFTPGSIYLQVVENAAASPVQTAREWQYGGKSRLGPQSKSTQVVATGVVTWYDEDGTTALQTLTPSETAGTITVTPS